MTSYIKTISIKSQWLCTHYIVKTSLPLCIIQTCTHTGDSTCHQPHTDSCFAMQPVLFVRPRNYRDNAYNIPPRDRGTCNLKNVTLNSSFTHYTSIHNAPLSFSLHVSALYGHHQVSLFAKTVSHVIGEVAHTTQ
jgi:hypothetical protein